MSSNQQADSPIISSDATSSPAVAEFVEVPVDENATDENGVPNLAKYGYHCIRYMANCNGGFVYLGRNKTGLQNHVAIKRFTVDDLAEYELIAREASNMRAFSHPTLLELESCFVCSESIYMISPAMNLGSLHDIVTHYRTWGISEKAAAGIFGQIVEAVLHLHQKRFVHRDIRPKHILLDSRGNVKLSGFRFMIELNYRLDCVFEFDSHLTNQIYYFAPEVLAQNMHGYGTKSDIYMLGMSLCEALNGVVPFVEAEPMEMLYRKMNGQVPRPVDASSLEDDRRLGIDISDRPQVHLTRQFSTEVHEFVAKTLLFDPEIRPSAKQLKESVWLNMKQFKALSPKHIMQELDLDKKDFEFSLWQQEPLQPIPEPPAHAMEFDFSTLKQPLLGG